MSSTTESGAPDPAQLHKPLSRLLRPLVRLMIRSGMTFPALCDLLRELYVNVAEHEFALAGKVQTDSRVSLLTGIHRKEVSRLRGAGTPLSTAPVALSRTSRIMARWLGGPPFSDTAGNPLPLPRTAADGPSFDALVTAVTRDLRPRAILDEWSDRGMIALTEDDKVVLRQSAYLPPAGDAQQLYYFGRNLHDHLAGATANVAGHQPPFFERSVHYGGLSATLAEELSTRSREIATSALQSANVEANSACTQDAGGTWRWNFGIYIYAEEAPQTSVAPTPQAEPEP